MAWIIAGAAILSALASASSQNQASQSSSRQGALASANKPKPKDFTPTTASLNPLPGPRNSPEIRGTAPAARQPDLVDKTLQQSAGQQGGDSSALNNASEAANLGATLQQLFRGEQQRGQAERAQAMASIAPQAPSPFQSTASAFQDPRIAELLRRQGGV